MNDCSIERIPVNSNRSVHYPNAFAYAGKTRPFASQRCFDIETFCLNHKRLDEGA